MVSENYEQFMNAVRTFNLLTRERYINTDIIEVLVISKRDKRPLREPVYFNRNSLERLWDYDRHNEVK